MGRRSGQIAVLSGLFLAVTMGMTGYGSSVTSSSWTEATVAGETLVAVVSIDSDNEGSAKPSITPASGDWGSPLISEWNEADCLLEVYVIEDAASRSGTETFNISDPIEPSQDANLNLYRLPADFNVKQAQSTQGADTSTGLVSPTLTLDGGDHILLYVASHERAPGTITGPTNGYTELANQITSNTSADHHRNSQYVAWKLVSAADTYAGADYSLSNAHEWSAGLLAFGAGALAVTD